MAGYTVFLRIERPKTTKEDVAFLGPLHAMVARGPNGVTVTLDVEADDEVAALTRARDLVFPLLPGKIGHATVTATDGLLIKPGRLFRRKRN